MRIPTSSASIKALMMAHPIAMPAVAPELGGELLLLFIVTPRDVVLDDCIPVATDAADGAKLEVGML